MQEYEIWSEGYLCTGMEGVPEKAQLFGISEGNSFKDACIKFFSKQEDGNYFNEEAMAYYGVKLHDNEADARKRFG